MEGGCYFVSAAILRHQPLMDTPGRRGWFYEGFLGVVGELEAELVAWVILPNHYHGVIRAGQQRTIPRLVQHLHARSARQFNREDGVPNRQV